MATGSLVRESENLRKLLSVAVRSVQWSYAIFWSLSTTQQGVLEWGDGYYNGEVKTRKTVPTAEVYADKLGLRRSEQLRELYESLLEGESELENANARPAAVLSPEDLSDLEWFYLVCMSFTFKVGQSLPGKAYANGESVWLCNAQDADSKLFTRSLLAKSASVKTVICFTHMGGVIELGVTDLIAEDPKLIQHIKTTLLEFAKPVCVRESSTDQENEDYDMDKTSTKIPEISQEIPEQETFVNLCPPVSELNNIGSPDDSFMLDFNGNDIMANSPVQSWHLVDGEDDYDDDLSRCIQESFNSSGCISQACLSLNYCLQVKKIQDCNDTKFSSLDIGDIDTKDEDLHYKKTVAVILQSSPFLVNGQSVSSHGTRLSCFLPWKKTFLEKHHSPQPPQKTLKKILFTVPSMISNKYGKEEKNNSYHVLSSVVPSINKAEKAAILNETVDYLKELEARVEELESCINQSDCEAKARKQYNMAEQMSDNYDNNSRTDPKAWLSKRKASEMDENETEPELDNNNNNNNNAANDMKVVIRNEEVVIELRCPWREYLLLDVMDAVNSLCLDAHTVQSSTVGGVLILSLKSKFRGSAFASAGMIKRALGKMVGIC